MPLSLETELRVCTISSDEPKEREQMTPEEFRTAGHQLIDCVADFRVGIRSRPIIAQVEPGHVKAQLSDAPPEEPESFEQILRDLEEIIVPGLSHFQHPRFFGYFPANGVLSSVLGDYLSTGLGSLGLSWQSAPALTELEEMDDRLDAPDGWSLWSVEWCHSEYCINCYALRAHLCPRAYDRIWDDPLWFETETKPLIVYVSEYSHSSVDKDAFGCAPFYRHTGLRHCPTRYMFELGLHFASNKISGGDCHFGLQTTQK